MADYKVTSIIDRTYQIKGGKLVEGYETEFYVPEFDTVHRVRTPNNNPDVVRAAILKEIGNLRKVYGLSAE
jgi:hypothetical protein